MSGDKVPHGSPSAAAPPVLHHEPHKVHEEEPPKPAAWGFNLFAPAPAPAHDHAHDHPHPHPHPPADETKAPESNMLGTIGTPFTVAGEGVVYGAEQTGKGAVIAGEYVVGGAVTAGTAIGTFFIETIPSVFVPPAPHAPHAPHPEGHPPHAEGGHPPAAHGHEHPQK